MYMCSVSVTIHKYIIVHIKLHSLIVYKQMIVAFGISDQSLDTVQDNFYHNPAS